MTEEEWLVCSDPRRMLDFLRLGFDGRERKLVLFGVGCCRRVWRGLADARSRRAVEVAELFADGHVTPAVLGEACREAEQAQREVREGRRGYEAAQAAAATALASVWVPAGWPSAVSVATLARRASERLDEPGGREWAEENPNPTPRDEVGAQALLLRDIFGNPFRPVPFDPAWRTSTAVALASQMYESRDFGAMPILADALQDAGCTSDDILDHCRGPGPHARGCWVVDLVLGKE